MTGSTSSDHSPVHTLCIAPEHSYSAALAAAGIWARATARRDHLAVVPLAKDKLPGIEGALSHEGSQLLVARGAGAPVAFAILVPRVAVVEILYLAVDPRAWGKESPDSCSTSSGG